MFFLLNIFTEFLFFSQIAFYLFFKQETHRHVIFSGSNSQLVFSVPPHHRYKQPYVSTCLSRKQTNHEFCLCLHQYMKYVYSQNNKYKQVELLSMMFTLNTTAQKHIDDSRSAKEIFFFPCCVRETLVSAASLTLHVLMTGVSTALVMFSSVCCVLCGVVVELLLVGKTRPMSW